MPDREKVMRGLNLCSADRGYLSCRECPYAIDANGVKRPSSTCVMELTSDALDLLKEQEARVMTLKEIRTGEIETLWIEVEGKPHIFPGIWYRRSKKDGIPAIDITLNTGIVRGTVVSYGYAWRCWTSRPTEEQRQNTPWEPPKEDK